MALIDELKERRERQTESLATIYEAIREWQEYLRGVQFELEDLDRAIAALEPPAQPHGELRSVTPATEENSGDQILQTIATINVLDNPDRVSENFTLLDPAVLRDEPEIPEGASFDTSNWQLEGNNFLAEQESKAEPEVEGYAPVVDAEAVLDATELARVTIDKVPPTAEVIKDQNGRAKFALFGGQTHEVVEPSNTEADFWARVLHPRKREEA